MQWGCWVELEDKDVHCKEWKCIIENFTEKGADITVHRIYGQCATLSINYKPEDWDSVRAWILKAGSGWHQAETAEDPQDMNSRITRSGHSGRVTRSGQSAPHQVDTLGSISGAANATVAASVASLADHGRWAQEGLPIISISNHRNREREA